MNHEILGYPIFRQPKWCRVNWRFFSITSSSLDSFCRGCPCSCREGWDRPVGLWSQFVQTQQILTFILTFLLTFLAFYLFKMIFGSFDVIFVSMWNVICFWRQVNETGKPTFHRTHSETFKPRSQHWASNFGAVATLPKDHEMIKMWIFLIAFANVCDLVLKLEAQCWLGRGGASRSGCWLMAIKWRRVFSRYLGQNL